MVGGHLRRKRENVKNNRIGEGRDELDGEPGNSTFSRTLPVVLHFFEPGGRSPGRQRPHGRFADTHNLTDKRYEKTAN